MKDLFTVGEMSKLFNINIKTLRYYDEIGLFKPIFVDESNGYRYYSTQQFEQLNTINYLKALGISLNMIDYHLKKRTIDNVIEMFEKQKEIAEEKIREFEFIKQRLDHAISNICDARTYDNLNQIQELELKRRTILTLKHKVTSNADLELAVRELGNRGNENTSIFNGKVGLSISREHLMNKAYEEYDSIFILTEHKKYDRELIKVLPKGIYAAIRFNGTHENSPFYYNQLIDYIHKNGYEILDDSFEITQIDYALTTDKSEFITEIQILINKG